MQTRGLGRPLSVLIAPVPALVQPASSSLHTAVAMAASLLIQIFLGSVVLFCRNAASQNDLDVPAIIIFGDSTVDVGNNNVLNTIMRSSHLPYGRSFGSGQPTGRFSDGNLAVDYIADKLNLSYPLAYSDSAAKGNSPNLLRGINFASAGSGLIDSTSKLFNTIDFAKQLTWFDDYKTRLAQVAGQAESDNLISKALYIISTANNDYVYYRLNPTVSSNYNPQQFSSMVLSKFAGYVEQIHARGARRIAIVSVAPLGCLPSEMTAAGLLQDSNRHCVDSVNDMARSYNAQLQRLIPSLHSQLPAAKIAYLDCFNVIYDAVQNPAKYGFTETRKGCCGSGLIEVGDACNQMSMGTCQDSSKFVFWDSFHPTSAMYKIIADKFYIQARPILL